MNSSSALKARSSRSLLRRFRDQPLRVKLALTFMLVVALSLAIVGALVDQRTSADLRENVGQTLKNRADSRAQVVGEWVRQESEELAALSFNFLDDLRAINASYPDDAAAQTLIEALDSGAQPDLAAEHSALLQAYVQTGDEHVAVLLTDRYGILVTASEDVSRYTYADQDWWQAAWNGGSGAIHVGNPEPHGDSELMVLPIAAAVRDPQTGEALGVIRGTYRLDRLYNLVDSVRFGETGSAMLIFPGALQLAEGSTLQPLPAAVRDQLALAIALDYAEIDIDGTPRLTSQAEIPMPDIRRPADSEWRLVIVQEVRESMQIVQAVRMTHIGGGLLALVIGTAVGYLLSRMLARSIDRLASTVQAFGGGDYATRVPINRSDEIGQLGAAFNDMADAIQTREIELQQWSSTLDRAIKERTSELMQANESLQSEIAERQRIQFEVMLERVRLEALIESSHDGLILIGVDQRIQVINQMALRLLDLPGIPHDWLRYAIGDLQGLHDGAVLEGLRHLREVSASQPDEAPIQRGEFTVGSFDVQWVNLPVEADEVSFGRLIVLHDVTQQHMLERLRDDLIHTMVHDLRNPLGNITVAMDLFSDDELTTEQRSIVSITKESLTRMTSLVNAILDIGRFEAGSMPLELAPVSFREISAEMLTIQQPLAQQKNLTLVQDIPDDLPLVEVDRDLISRVVQNLVGNAIKFTPKDGTITLAAHLDGDNVLVMVKDSGTGIAPDVRDRLFQKFATGKQRGRGSGLGLAFSRLAIEAHGGRIWVESTGSDGTTFKFTLSVSTTTPETEENLNRKDAKAQRT